jgi:peptidoglycan/xylan/chitin deacetylase (PgdA/CDA1 family)
MTIGALTGGPGPIPVVHRIPTFDPVVFLTIDDGVVKDPAVIEILRSRGVPVTQFLTQQYVGSDPSYFAQLQQVGGVIGTHTRSHPKVPRLDEGSQRDQICGTAADYAATFGVAPELYRPPYGEYDALSVQIAASCGHRAVMHWSATFEAGRLALQSGTALRPGEVILLHFKDNLASDLQILLDMIAAAGLRPASLIDYVRAAPPAPPV